MTFPILAGVPIAADAVNQIPPVFAVKPIDQDIASSVTLANDSALFLPVLASTTYQILCFLDYEGGTLGSSDIQWEWTIPSGATLRYFTSYFGIGGGWNGQMATAGTIVQASSNGAGAARPVIMIGSLIVASTAGNVQLKWSQNTSSSTPTIVHAQSYLSLQQVLLT